MYNCGHGLTIVDTLWSADGDSGVGGGGGSNEKCMEKCMESVCKVYSKCRKCISPQKVLKCR